VGVLKEDENGYQIPKNGPMLTGLEADCRDRRGGRRSKSFLLQGSIGETKVPSMSTSPLKSAPQDLAFKDQSKLASRGGKGSPSDALSSPPFYFFLRELALGLRETGPVCKKIMKGNGLTRGGFSKIV